jgi:hypothetical protein
VSQIVSGACGQSALAGLKIAEAAVSCVFAGGPPMQSRYRSECCEPLLCGLIPHQEIDIGKAAAIE